jgi:putative phosphoesterase
VRELPESDNCVKLHQMSNLVVGLLSDTHIPHRLKRLPQAALDALAGVDVILHAGDVDDPAALEPLRAIAPVHAVRGNFHVIDFSDGGAALPEVVEMQLAEQHIVLTHGHRPGPVGFCLKVLLVFGNHLRLVGKDALNRRTARRLARLYPTADIIVFGHSHYAHVEWVGHKLLVNPGAIFTTGKDKPSVARMRLGPGRPEVEIIPVVLEHHATRSTQYVKHPIRTPAGVLERRCRYHTYGGE